MSVEPASAGICFGIICPFFPTSVSSHPPTVLIFFLVFCAIAGPFGFATIGTGTTAERPPVDGEMVRRC